MHTNAPLQNALILLTFMITRISFFLTIDVRTQRVCHRGNACITGINAAGYAMVCPYHCLPVSHNC